MLRLSFPEPLDRFETVPITVPAQHELRIHHNFLRKVYIQLVDGSAEIAGCQMIFEYYHLPPELKSISVYAHSESKINLVCEPATRSSIRHYLQPDEDEYFGQLFALNAILEEHRRHAFTTMQSGPKVLVMGSECAGKMTLIRTLTNYAVKNEWKPIFADMDPIDSKLSSFGVISAAVIGDYMPYTLGDQSKVSFFFGYDSMDERFEIYSKQVAALSQQIAQKIDNHIDVFKSALAGGVFLEGDHKIEYFEQVKARLAKGQATAAEAPSSGFNFVRINPIGGQDPSRGQNGSASSQAANDRLVKRILDTEPEQVTTQFPIKLVNDYVDKEVFASGVFYDLPNEVSSFKPNEIQEIIDIIGPDYIIVIADDYLKSQVQAVTQGRPITLIRFPKNSGVTLLTPNERRGLRQVRTGYPVTSDPIKFFPDFKLTSEITVYQVESAKNSPLQYIKAVDKNLILKKIDFATEDLRDKILGLINLPVAEKLQINDILSSELVALLQVTGVDDRIIRFKKQDGTPENYQRLVMCLGNLHH